MASSAGWKPSRDSSGFPPQAVLLPLDKLHALGSAPSGAPWVTGKSRSLMMGMFGDVKIRWDSAEPWALAPAVAGLVPWCWLEWSQRDLDLIFYLPDMDPSGMACGRQEPYQMGGGCIWATSPMLSVRLELQLTAAVSAQVGEGWCKH
ncbi:hypothetical protein P7K49_015023 [Saguinus oedipus]|uniref:Uncharacterized protein n=1 Tax=Saguinus oedipus TaxID=9490 RepID=A0ABQ9V819_SAGOE|nr:hypothetical protein P7K49_015023 [Saguinus oedipus]